MEEIEMTNLKEFNEDVLKQEDQLQAVAKAAGSFKDNVKDYNKDAEKFRQSLQQDVPVVKDKPDEVIENEIRAANARLKGVLNDSSALMAQLGETATKNRAYNGLKEQLAKSLPSMEERMEDCEADIRPGSDPKDQLNVLNKLTADVISEGKHVDDLRDVGEELMGILKELDCGKTPKAREIQNTVEEVQAKFDHIQEGVVDKQHKLNAALAQTQDVGHNIDNLLHWVNQKEGVFDDMEPVSLDKDALNEQIQAHRVMVSDIESHRAQVESLAKQCRGSPAMEASIEQLVDRFDILESRAEQRGSELEDIVQKLGTLHGNVNQLESWLGNAVYSLKRESSDFEPGALKHKIEDLYRQKQGKQEDLDNIKNVGRDLIEDPNTGDKNPLRETLADVQGKWHDLTELLVQMISFAALREIDDLLKYLDKAENDINTAEPISTDPETLAVQLRDHTAFHDDLETKRKAVNNTIDKCNKMLRETTNEEADDIKNKLGTIRNQADLVCKLSNERLELLEEALPLATHLSETQADLQSWLGEIEAEIESLEVPADGNAEQIRKHQDNAKTTQRIIEDHKPLVEDLNASGQELMEMCTDEDASDLKEDVDNVNAKYDEVKAAIREKLAEIDEALRSVTCDVGDTIDGLLEELHYLNDQVEHADPIGANPDALREQINDNQTLLDDLDRRQPAILAAKDDVRNMLDLQTPDNAEECEDLRSKLQDLDTLQDNIQHQTTQRAANLDDAYGVAEKFHHEYQDVIRTLRDIQDNLLSQDSPGVDPPTIEEQQKELLSIQDELEYVDPRLGECRKTVEVLEGLCGTPARMELQKYMEDIDNALEDINDGIGDRRDELHSALDKAEKFEHTLQTIMSWLPKSEEKMKHMRPIAADPRSVRIQIEELKVYNVGVKPRFVEIQSLNQYASDLKNASPVTAESLVPQVKDVNVRWNRLLGDIQDRETKLQEALVRLGEVEAALEDMIGFLQQTEEDLQGMDDVYGDPKCIETQLKKIQLIQKDLKSQEMTVNTLNKAVDEMIQQSGKTKSPMLERQKEMNELFHSVQLLSCDRRNQLQDILKEVKAFIGDVEDTIRWFTDFRNHMKTTAPMGALPDTAQKQFDKFMAKYNEMERKEDEVQALLINGEDMMARCREGEVQQLRENLDKLRDKLHDVREKAERRRHKLEEHLANVRDFHAMLKIHTDWLSNAEKILGSFKHPSKLVDRILQQIKDHKTFKEDIEGHREIMMNLDRTGTYLKYFGRKQDTVYIKNLLISIKLRWKKLVRRADEKGRMLQQAHKEDKRFYNSWKGLCDWLDDSERRLKKYTNAGPAKVKQDIDELKLFQHQLSAKHPSYYSTTRLGRNLKDRCTKADPERDILQSMLDDLKNRWSIIRSIVSQKQNKLDEALLSSGRFTDALQSLLEWLGKAEAYLAEDQPILGDLDTITILSDQHKAFQQELESRQGVVMAMKGMPADGGLGAQLDELTTVWDRVNQLSDVREARLQEASKLAEDFNEAVQVVREWLPHAEQELKFRALPEDEDAIVDLIEKHEKLQDELRGQQPNIERIKYLAEEILQGCHPNAVRFVKYYLTITQTRWEQASNRANQRSQRLQEALRNTRGNAALLEELLAWMTEAQVLLSTKEKDVIPEDLTVVEALVKEHLEFHDDLLQKNKDVERITKIPTTSERRRQLGGHYGSSWKLHESDTPSPRFTTLQNKWRNVWRVSVDRKKKKVPTATLR